jgi:hypothetical protein
MASKGEGMKTLIWIVIVALLGFGVKKGVDYMQQDSERKLHRDRVAVMLEGLKKDGNYTAAMGMWYAGMLNLQSPGLGDLFEGFRSKAGIAGVLKEVSVGEATIVKRRGPPEAAARSSPPPWTGRPSTSARRRGSPSSSRPSSYGAATSNEALRAALESLPTHTSNVAASATQSFFAAFQ